MHLDQIARLIKTVPDFPEPGIQFRDITPVLSDRRAARSVIAHMEIWAGDRHPDLVVGIESRGFMFGMPLATRIGSGFVPVRKSGKLPRARISESYSLEYGDSALEIHDDALGEGDEVMIVDDLLATGGTAAAAGRLVERLGAKVLGYLFVIELTELEGRAQLGGADTHSLIRF